MQNFCCQLDPVCIAIYGRLLKVNIHPHVSDEVSQWPRGGGWIEQLASDTVRQFSNNALTTLTVTNTRGTWGTTARCRGSFANMASHRSHAILRRVVTRHREAASWAARFRARRCIRRHQRWKFARLRRARPPTFRRLQSIVSAAEKGWRRETSRGRGRGGRASCSCDGGAAKQRI